MHDLELPAGEMCITSCCTERGLPFRAVKGARGELQVVPALLNFVV